MSNELDKMRNNALQSMLEMNGFPVAQEFDFTMNDAKKISLKSLSTLGVAFEPLTTAIQTAVTGGGGSGLYYVDTRGMQMFSTREGFIGSLKSDFGSVGGGQARMKALACNPTMLFMAAALINIEQKLDAIQQTQEEIIEFLAEKERAIMQGNLNVLDDVMSNFKYNWDNNTYKVNKHILVQQIKKEAEAGIVLYRDQIAKKLQKRSLIHSDQEVKGALKKIQAQFKDYQLTLYLYAYSTFLEVMLLGNFGKSYLDSVEQRISEYSLQYRTLYTEAYSLMEDYANSSIQSKMLGGLAVASKLVGETISKVPVIGKSKLDNDLIEMSGKIDRCGKEHTVAALEGLVQTRASVTRLFVENIREINDLYNKPVIYLFDRDGVYVRQISC